MEITENEGLTSSRQWETHQEIQTSGNLDEQQDMVDSDEEWPLVIKQEEEDSDLFAEDSEVTKLWKKVIADLSIEGLNSYKCRICSFESPLHVWLRAHISNRHFNGPVASVKYTDYNK